MDKVIYKATVPMISGTNKTQFKFIDCMAEYINEERIDGYGKRPEKDKYGEYRAPEFSYVTGLIGGAVECNVFPEQFNLPHTPLEKVHFYSGPEEILFACVRAIAEERLPPEYVI